MATSTDKKECFECHKHKTVYRREGCSQNYCFDCLVKHRQSVAKRLDEFQDDCNQFRQKVNEQKQDPNINSLIEKVKQWERNSIEKIKITADECREILIKQINQNTNNVERRLNDICEQVRLLHDENESNETDLNRFQMELTKLEENLAGLPCISVKQRSTPFICEIWIDTSSTKTMENVIQPITGPNSCQHRAEINTTARSIIREPDASNIKYKMPTMKIESGANNVAKQVSPFVRSRKLDCKGHCCAKCGHCRDWCFTGDVKVWKWIQNVNNWTHVDEKRWRNGQYWEKFKLGDDATCTYTSIYFTNSIRSASGSLYSILFDIYHDSNSSDFSSRICLCPDNTINCVLANVKY